MTFPHNTPYPSALMYIGESLSLCVSHPLIGSTARVSILCHSKDHELKSDTICLLQTYWSRFLCRFSAAMFFPIMSLVIHCFMTLPFKMSFHQLQVPQGQ